MTIIIKIMVDRVKQAWKTHSILLQQGREIDPEARGFSSIKAN